MNYIKYRWNKADEWIYSEVYDPPPKGSVRIAKENLPILPDTIESHRMTMEELSKIDIHKDVRRRANEDQ